jgi:hypothetical protein
MGMTMTPEHDKQEPKSQIWDNLGGHQLLTMVIYGTSRLMFISLVISASLRLATCFASKRPSIIGDCKCHFDGDVSDTLW